MTGATIAAPGPSDRRSPSGAAVYPSTCWECSVCCGSLLTVENGRVTDIVPNPDQPHSKGAFRIKGIRGALGVTYGRPGCFIRCGAPARAAAANGNGFPGTRRSTRWRIASRRRARNTARARSRAR